MWADLTLEKHVSLEFESWQIFSINFKYFNYVYIYTITGTCVFFALTLLYKILSNSLSGNSVDASSGKKLFLLHVTKIQTGRQKSESVNSLEFRKNNVNV